MGKILSQLTGALFARAFARRAAPAACALALCFVTAGATNARTRSAHGGLADARQQAEKQKPTPFDEDDGGESESEAREAARPRVTDPATIMRRARFIFVRSNSEFVSEREVEDSLRKRKEFQAWGMIITRNEGEADLVLEISRKAFTRRFTFTVVDPRTMEVVTSGKTRSVLFGKKIPNKVAEKFANRVKAVRPYPPVPGQTP